jgi:hypothetical protein
VSKQCQNDADAKKRIRKIGFFTTNSLDIRGLIEIEIRGDVRATHAVWVPVFGLVWFGLLGF